MAGWPGAWMRDREEPAIPRAEAWPAIKKSKKTRKTKKTMLFSKKNQKYTKKQLLVLESYGNIKEPIVFVYIDDFFLKKALFFLFFLFFLIF